MDQGVDIREVVNDETAKQLGVLGSTSPIPNGRYKAHIVRSELRRNKANTFDQLEFVLRILDGEQAGRTLKEYLALKHPDRAVRDMAKRKLVTMVYACGLRSIPNDTIYMHKRPFYIEVRVRERKDKKGFFANDITCWFDERANQVVEPGGRNTANEPSVAAPNSSAPAFARKQ